tara:strand:- start:2108 stop:3040 length:933 start_codon:yes stop_codon:yes gene_type:complete
MKHNKAIVLGANGFLGLNLCYWLLKNNFSVQAIGRQEKFKGEGIFELNNLNYQQIDISKEDELAQLNLSEYSLIFMFAGKTGTKAGFDQYQDYVQSNEIALLNILSLYQRQTCEGRLVFPSSRLVYKGAKGIRLKEDAEKEAKTVYAANKIACEKYVFAFSNVFSIPYTVFRICVPYGQLIPGDYSYGTMGFMLSQAKNNRSISLYGKGEPSRTFSHIKDICTLIGEVSQLKSSEGKTYNIGGKDNYDLKTLATKVASKTGAVVKFIDWPSFDLAIESGDTMFDDSAIQKVYPYDYKGDIDSYIENLELA